MKASINSKIFYHIYPFGLCGAPERNDFSCPSGTCLQTITKDIPRLKDLGITALYIGPVFESTAHGYDTLDYFNVDRRLGNNADLTHLVSVCHQNGIAVVLDAVLNHTGRHFFAFKDLQEKGRSSAYASWFKGVDFNRQSPEGDSFYYEGWSGHYDLVKLNTSHQDVKDYLFSAIRFWIEEFNIDGLRLDAADVLEPAFMDELNQFCSNIAPDFWLMGEVVHGDYRNWVQEGRLHSVTNYEAYKGLWSSFNDKNFFEIAWSLNRQSGPEGIYRNFQLYTFVDNHDVNRVASVLKDQAHLFPLYGLLFTIPGIPSIYYGSEWGLRGEKRGWSDAELRPRIEIHEGVKNFTVSPPACIPLTNSEALEHTIKTLAKLKTQHPALNYGDYRQIHVASEQFVFERKTQEETIIVAVNASSTPCSLSIPNYQGTWHDALESQDSGPIYSQNESIPITIPPTWLRILVKSNE